MRFKVAERSLFAYLLRSSWWVSIAIAIVVTLLARLILPSDMAAYSPSVAFPFVLIAGYVAWKQFQAPSTAQVAFTVETVSAMSWRDFSALMETALQRDGCEVKRTSGVADFVLVKAGRKSLLSCKRWKAASHGLEPLRELDAARESQEAHEVIYVATGELSENARRFAQQHKIRLMQGAELAQLLRLPRKPAKTKA